MSASPLPPFLRGVDHPVFFEDALRLTKWDLNKLSLCALADAFQGPHHEFRLGKKDSDGVVWEGK